MSRAKHLEILTQKLLLPSYMLTGIIGALVPCYLDLSLAQQFGECLCMPLLPGSTFAIRVGIRERYKIRVSAVHSFLFVYFEKQKKPQNVHCMQWNKNFIQHFINNFKSKMCIGSCVLFYALVVKNVFCVCFCFLILFASSTCLHVLYVCSLLSYMFTHREVCVRTGVQCTAVTLWLYVKW